MRRNKISIITKLFFLDTKVGEEDLEEDEDLRDIILINIKINFPTLHLALEQSPTTKLMKDNSTSKNPTKLLVKFVAYESYCYKMLLKV